MYLDGRGITKNPSSAFEWFRFAADIGSSAAQIQISHFFETGTVVNHDCHIAMSWLLKAANDGKMTKQDNEAQQLYFYIADFYYKGHDDFEKDLNKAKYWYEKAAELDHPDALLCLGYMYQHGEGVVGIDYFKALDWYSKAAHHEKTGGSAFFNIGLLYRQGHGAFEENSHTAFIYFLQAAVVGHAKSQFKTALMYQNGEGDVEKDFQQAYTWYTASEENKNYKVAQYNIGHLYRDGYGDFKQDFKMAFQWYQLAADQGYELAEVQLGILYHNGSGVEKNYHQALYWYSKSESNTQDPITQYNIAKLYLHGYGDFKEDTAKAVEWMRKAAEQGDSEAQFKMGVMYHNGAGVNKNYWEANTWYLKSIEQREDKDDDLCFLNLAKLHRFGYADFNKDEALALYYYKVAADLGNRQAMVQLGIMYQNGAGIPNKDHKTALSWYTKVSDDDEDAYLAFYNIGNIYFHGVPDVIMQDYKEAFKWFMKAALKDDSESQYMIGVMYNDGLGVLKDVNKAIEWYQKSSDKGYVDAKYALALLYHTGNDGVGKDEPLALKLYLEVLSKTDFGYGYNNVGYMYETGAANLPVNYKIAMEYYLKADKFGCSSATNTIGIFYLNGYGVEKDYAKAFQWLTKAMEDGSVQAIAELGKMYFHGQFVERDQEVAYDLFKSAMDLGHEPSSIQWYLDQINTTSGVPVADMASPELSTTNRIIENKLSLETIAEHKYSSDKEHMEQEAIEEEQGITQSLSTERRIELLEEQLRLQSLEMERLLRMNSPVNYHPPVSQTGIATRVEPFHFVVPTPITTNDYKNVTMVSGDSGHQPIYSVQPQREFQYRSTSSSSNIKIESHKLLNIDDDLGPSSLKTVDVMKPEEVDLLSEQPMSPSQAVAMPPLIRDDGTTSTLSIFEELSLISFDDNTTAVNTKPDIKDDARVYIVNKPNEISSIQNKPNSLDDLLVGSSSNSKRIQKIESLEDDYLIETFVRKASIKRTVENRGNLARNNSKSQNSPNNSSVRSRANNNIDRFVPYLGVDERSSNNTPFPQ